MPGSSCAASQTPYEEAIVRYVSEHVGAPAFVIHELESELVHVDVHVVPPDVDRDYWFLFTTGMSARRMAVPPGAHAAVLAEMTMRLPSNWVFDRAAWARDSRWFWPIRELREAALLPHRHRTWLANGHTISSPDRETLDPSTELSSLIVIEGIEELGPVRCQGESIDLLTLWPLHASERDLVVQSGSCSLIDLFVGGGSDFVIKPERPPLVTDTGDLPGDAS